MTTLTQDAGLHVPVVTRPAPRRRFPAATCAVLAGTLAVLAFWWFGTPAATGSTPGGALSALGELAGLLASFLVCVQLLLVARVPWFETAVGQDRLVSWHRTLGTTVVLLVLTHVLLMIVGGALLDSLTPWAEVPNALARQPYLWSAVIGTALFVLVGLSSARGARAHLSYEAWFALHLTTYVAIYLAFAHQVVGGTHFVTALLARTVWVLLYAATAGAILTWRVALPLLAHRQHQLRVAAVVPEGRGLTSIWLEGRDVAALAAQGGQFFLVRFLTRGHWGTAHPYSLSMVPTAGHLRFTVGALGDHSSAVPHLRPGTRVLVEGPYGRFTAQRATAPKVLLVAGGAGVGPIRALAEDLLRAGHDLVVLHRAHDAESLALAAEFTPSAALRYVPLPGRRADLGHDPLHPSTLRHLVPDVAERDVFVCGPDGMIAAVVGAARSLGVPAGAIHREELT
ncbi:ferric reductase-like transmembrane domain-containing protein [Cellulomonas sp.]|uniref:ferredoxin reductase family protein n=1 Tax=Cellulomonas sp. TaxID=40001 RepID=UPI001B25DE09|nr:ferric reductase-like transmembrane domain-containing protein [Cellulomonas sp.]MBO9555015.1 ferric reductase-like transmembrane domain-containing protein [Cellulomonas sp.]